MAVDRRGVGVEVIGVPDLTSNERTVDKLLIHFLRPRNGGGEVQRVLYPLHTPGHALIIYEEPNVAARVLQKRHELEVGNQTFPLEVKPVDRPEFDHPVEATVNFNTIADTTELKRLLHRHGLEVIHWDNGWARVKGSVMMLRPFMVETQKLLKAQTRNLTRPSSSSSPLGSPSPPAAHSKNTHSNSARAKQNPSWSTEAPPYASPSSSPSPTSFNTSSSSSWAPEGPVDPVDRRRPTPKPEESSFTSFVTSSDGLQYVQCYKKFAIEDILAKHDVRMDVMALDNDVSRVVVTGWCPPEASIELQHFLSDIGAALHVRQIPLGGLDHDAQVGVAKRIQELKHDFPTVLILQKGDAIHLVGPRLACELLKEAVLKERPAQSRERPAESQARTGRRGGKRGAERGKEVKRRSQSLPRSLPYAGGGGGGGGEGEGEPGGGADPTMLASLGGGRSWPRAGDEGGQGQDLTPEVKSQRGLSNIMTRTRAKTEDTANYGGPEKPNLRHAMSPTMLLPARFQLTKKNKQSAV